VPGLLGISVAIAVIGIANTLGLSVLERAREHAMLRALGLTRGQLRRMLAAEAMLLSVVATGLGTMIGVGFGWVGYETFVAVVPRLTSPQPIGGRPTEPRWTIVAEKTRSRSPAVSPSMRRTRIRAASAPRP
jgi:ABC-type antimicrobial peptide transport system permease subunit